MNNEDIKVLEKYIKEQKEFIKQFNLEEIEDGTEGQRRIQAIENLIKGYKKLEKENIQLYAFNGKLQCEQAKIEQTYKNTGKIVKNRRDGKVGVVLREFETGQIQVLEKIGDKGGKVINTHDSWKTLEVIEIEDE